MFKFLYWCWYRPKVCNAQKKRPLCRPLKVSHRLTRAFSCCKYKLHVPSEQYKNVNIICSILVISLKLFKVAEKFYGIWWTFALFCDCLSLGKSSWWSNELTISTPLFAPVCPALAATAPPRNINTGDCRNFIALPFPDGLLLLPRILQTQNWTLETNHFSTKLMDSHFINLVGLVCSHWRCQLKPTRRTRLMG